jgi:hypothetical protein
MFDSMFSERAQLKFMILKINNDKEAAIKSKRWKNPGASFYDKLLNSHYYGGRIPTDSKELDEMIKSGKYKDYRHYLKEAYLIAPVNKINNSPYGVTPFSKSGCKYPHHSIKGDELVVNISGLRAAYKRAKQMGEFKGDVKNHLERHYKELGLYDYSTMAIDEKMDNNFRDIGECILETMREEMGDDVDTFSEAMGITESKEKLYPIYGVLKSYSSSELRNDGTKKSDREIKSAKFSNQVKKLTRGDNYSHALISLDDELKEMYSFGDDGLEEDSIENPSWMGTRSLVIIVMFIPKKDLNNIKKYIDNLKKHKEETKYASANLLKMHIGRPYKVDKRFICSSFTAYLLGMSDAKRLHRDYSRLRPDEILLLPRAFYVKNYKDYKDFQSNHGDFKNRVNKIYEENEDELMDYNNHLPRLLLKEKMGKLKTFDKIFDWIINRL